MKELVEIQTELKASKDLYNKFANFAYRSAESILEALKPLLKKTNCHVTLTDEIVQVADRIYVKATATIKNSAGASESVSAFAREELSKKGQDASQTTGSASSYARKYALGGLFAVDDGRDADSSPNSPVNESKLKGDFDKAVKKIDGCKTRAELQALNEKCKSLWSYQPYVAYMTNKYNTLQQ